jgi:glycosyltransferase involved in cell wall biosynthesis
MGDQVLGQMAQQASQARRSEKSGARAAEAPLKVLLIAPSIDILGGQAVQAVRLLGQLSKEPRLEIAFLPINPRLPGILGKLQTIKYVRTVVTSIFYIAMLLARVRKYDLVHIFSASYLSFVISQTPAILISKLYRKKIILNYRSGEAEDHLRRWPSALRTIRLVDLIVAPSGYLVDVFAQFGFRAHSISNMVDTSRFSYRERRPFRPVFLANRNLEPMYNVGCILRAFALIQRRFPEARLSVAGDGSQRARLERLASELGLRNTTFVGRVPNESMDKLYSEADIYLNSSNIDNMPGSIIEAFACGLPVVTTNAGGIPYIVTNEETGLIVALGDHEAIARSAIRLIEDQELAEKISARAREECNRYGLAAVRSEWITLYRELAGRTRADRGKRTPAARGSATEL